MEKIIEIRDATMNYRMISDRVRSIKEFIVQALKGKIEYKDFVALKNVSIEIERGEVVGLIGHNGAGKSTLLKLISRIMKPTTGSIEVHGNVAPMLELGSGFDFDLTGRENIFLNGAILGYEEQFLNERLNDIIEFAELREFIDVPLRNYSSGMVARLGFSIATVVEPEILIVDEVLSVGDIQFQEKSGNRMKELMGGGTTVLLVSHDMDQIRELCDRVVWLDHGKVKEIGPAKKVCQDFEEFFSVS